MALTLFDLDNTLLNGDSDHAWGQFLVDNDVVDAATYEKENSQFYDDYVAGTLDIHEYSRFAFKVLEQTPANELSTLRKMFIETVIRPMITRQGKEVVKSHQATGDTLAIITATNSFVTRPIADEYGIRHLIATEPVIEDGQYRAEIAGTPCYREGKVTKLNDWLKLTGLSMDNSTFYSDSHNDIPLLEIVSHPVAVDPDDELRTIAVERCWKITSFR